MPNPGVTVYFRGFPDHVDNETLETLFAEYGAIVKCFVHKSRTYGMVEYEDISSCTTAINELNGKPPYNLYLNMAKNQSDRNNTNMNENKRAMPLKTSSPNVNLNAVAYEEQDVFVDDNNCVIDFLRDSVTNEIYVPIRYAPNIRRLVRKIPISVSNGCQDNGDIDNDDNVSVTADRKINYDSNSHDMKIHRSFTSERDTSPRRGFQRSPKPAFRNRCPSESRSKDYSNKMGDQRQNNRSFKTDYQSPGSGDENKPRFNNKYQGGGGDNNQSRFPRNDFASKISDKNERGWDNNAKVAEAKPNKFSLANHASTSANSSFNKPALKPKFSNKEDANWSASPAAAEEKIQKTEELSQNTSTSNTATSGYCKSSSIAKKLLPKKINKVSYKTVELPKNQFTEVNVEHVVDDTLGWVQIADKNVEVAEFMVKILERELSSPKTTEPEVGKICLAFFDDYWFRAVVLATTPKVRVRFIDYGNESDVNGELLELSPDFKEVPAYAINIKLANGTPRKMKLNTSFKVKPVSIDNDVVEVHVENGIYEREVAKPSTSSAIADSVTSPAPIYSLAACQKAMMDAYQPNMNGIFTMTLKLSDAQGVAYLLPEALVDDLMTLDSISNEIGETNSSFKPKVGDLVAAENEGWNRAFIISIKDGFKVAFIDFGTIKTVPEVKPLPDAFRNIPQFACVFKSAALDELQPQTEMCFKITKVLNGTVHCQFDEGLGDFTFVPWSPKVETSETSLNKKSSSSASSLETVKAVEKKLAPAELKLKNGDDVKIVDENDGVIFVRTKEGSEILKRVVKYIAQYAPKAPKITKEPVVGQFVVAEYDNIWYRAVVKTVQQTSAEILYIDYGNEEIKPFFSLKQIDEGCCQEPWSLIKIKLRDFVEKNFSKKNRTYLANLSETNQILKATFQNFIENGVDLTTKDGKNIVDELIKMDTVAPPFQGRKELYMKVKAPGEDDPRIMSIKLEEIPLGKGEVKFLSAIDIDNHTVCVCVNNPELLHKIHVDLLNQMTKYANHIAPKEPHVPLDEEIVLVQSEDKWYRALSLSEEEDGYAVFIIDYGFNITVTPDKIRKMPHDFIDGCNALGSFAIIEGLPDNPSRQLMDRMKSLFLKNETYKVNVLSKDTEDNYYVVFEDVLQQLKAEGLI